jgi:hypothetical protein
LITEASGQTDRLDGQIVPGEPDLHQRIIPMSTKHTH